MRHVQKIAPDSIIFGHYEMRVDRDFLVEWKWAVHVTNRQLDDLPGVTWTLLGLGGAIRGSG